MDKLHREILGFVLATCTLLSSYLALIQIVNTFKPDGLLKSLRVKSLRGMNQTRQFAIGDTLEFEVESQWASAYGLRVYENSSLVYDVFEPVLASPFRACLSIIPPRFGGKQVYAAFVDVYAHNVPVPGAYFSDSGVYLFEVLATETNMELDCTYNGSLRNLRLSANLTDADGYPVANETVAFSLQFSHRHRMTDGWFSVGSVSTDENGIAQLGIALNVSAGNYSAKASHLGNENFGESEDSFDFTVLGNETVTGFGLDGQPSPLSEEEYLEVWLGDPPTLTPYAGLEVNVTARYSHNGMISDCGPIDAVFYCDSVSSGGYLGFADLRRVGVGPPLWDYSGMLAWRPMLVGSHSLICRIFNNTDQTVLIEKALAIDIAPCPTNLVIHVPDAACSDALPVTVAFSKPRLYVETESGGFASYSLAPKIEYNGEVFAIDDPVKSVQLELFANDTVVSSGFSNADGLVFFMPQFSPSGSFSVRLRTEPVASILYEGTNATRDLVLTKVDVSDIVGQVSGKFRLNCTVNKSDQGEEPVYVKTETPVEVDTRLFGLPVHASNVSILTGKTVKRCWTDGSGWVAVPTGASLVRVAALCDLGASFSAYCDVTRDDKIDIKDVARVSGAFGSYPGHSKWNWLADLNFDGKVDIRDLAQVSEKVGSHGFGYVYPSDYSVVNVKFYKGGGLWSEAGLSFGGCAFLPIDQVDGLYMYLGGNLIGGVVEFFREAGYHECQTNNVGVVRVGWCPQEMASLIPGTQDSPGYCVMAWMPRSFEALASGLVSPTSVQDELRVARFAAVVKKGVNVTVDAPCEYYAQRMEFESDAYVCQNAPSFPHNGDELFTGIYPYDGHEDRSYIGFSLASVPSDAWIISAQIALYFKTCYAGGGATWGDFALYQVTSAWDESVTWNSRPSNASNPYLISRVYVNQSGSWLFFNITSLARVWHSIPSSNMGVLLKTYDRKALSPRFCSGEAADAALRPCLLVSYCTPSPEIVVRSYDGETQQSLAYLSFRIYINGLEIGDGHYTNDTGVRTFAWQPTANMVHNVTVKWSDAGFYSGGKVSSFFDYRLPTGLESLCGNHTEAYTGSWETYSFRLTPLLSWGLSGETVKFFFNGSSVGGTVFRHCYANTTVSDGVASIRWEPPANGTYTLKAMSEGSESYGPCECYVSVTVCSKAYSILFTVSPSEFELGASLFLNATVFDALTGLRAVGSVVKVQFCRYCSDGTDYVVASVWTNSESEACLSVGYPDEVGKAYAYVARIASTYEGSRVSHGVCSSPVQLTASKRTKMTLRVERDEGFYAIRGWLKVNSTGAPVVGETVKIKVNDSALMWTTGYDGSFGYTTDLKVIDNKPTTYEISASFNGSSPCDARGWSLMPDGTSYAACTTICFGYKPSASTTMLALEASAAQAAAQTKTSEGMQQEAKDSGWLSIWHEFTWSYPWYRLHTQVAVNPTIHIAMNPLLPGGEIVVWSTDFVELLGDLVEEALTEMVIEVGGLLSLYLSAKALSIMGRAAQPWLFALALVTMAIKCGIQIYLFAKSWTDKIGMLASAIVSTVLGLFALAKIDVLLKFVNTVADALSHSAASALRMLVDKLFAVFNVAGSTFGFCRDIVDSLEITADFCLVGASWVRFFLLSAGVP